MPAEQDRIPVGIYWDPQLWDDARAAFVSDLKHDPDPAPAFIAWLHRALEDHVARGPQGRAALGIERPEPRAPGQGQGRSRMSPLHPGTLDRVDDAVAADFEELDRLGGRSAFVQKAVTAAVAAARDRRPDRTLPPAPERLNNNPHRRRPLRKHSAAVAGS